MRYTTVELEHIIFNCFTLHELDQAFYFMNQTAQLNTKERYWYIRMVYDLREQEIEALN